MKRQTFWNSGFFGFLTRSDTNRAAQSRNITRDLKFRIKEEEVLYYPSSGDKDADQLRGYRETDLRPLFSHMHNSGFLTSRLILCQFGTKVEFQKIRGGNLFAHLQAMQTNLILLNFKKFEAARLMLMMRKRMNALLTSNVGDCFSNIYCVVWHFSNIYCVVWH